MVLVAVRMDFGLVFATATLRFESCAFDMNVYSKRVIVVACLALPCADILLLPVVCQLNVLIGR